MDLTKALSFIEEKGSGLEKAIAKRVVYGKRSEPKIVKSLVELQNEDGAFPYGMVKGNPGSMGDTTYALLRLRDLGFEKSAMADRTLRYILAKQKPDGGWDEEPTIARFDPPPWSTPGDLRARVYLSAYVAYWLALVGHDKHPAFKKALGFLLGHRDEKGRFYGFLHSTWIATSVFAIAGPRYRDVVRDGLEVLDNMPIGEWADSQISWALCFLAGAGVAKEHPFIAKSLKELVRRQAHDGSWASEDGEVYSVHATLEALTALKHYDVLEPPE